MRIFVQYILFLAFVSMSGYTFSESNFEEAKKKFFDIGLESCLEKMDKKFCLCATKINKELTTDDDLKKLFSGKIDFDVVLKKASRRYGECDANLSKDT